jgi:protein-disulfide isomerase
MLQKLFFLSFLFVAANTFAQQGKTTEKQAPEIDYKQPGAPLPRFKVLLYQDTSKKTMAETKAGQESITNESRQSRKRKKHSVDGYDASAPASGKYLTEANLADDVNFLVMMFNPTCGHCQDETVMLEKNISLFKKSRIIMLATPVMYPYLHDFVAMQHVNDYPQISVGIDSSRFMDNAFIYGALPQINVYSGDRKLLKIYNGEVSIDSLKQYIQ